MNKYKIIKSNGYFEAWKNGEYVTWAKTLKQLKVRLWEIDNFGFCN